MLRGSFRRFKKSKQFVKLLSRMEEELEKEKEEETAVDLCVVLRCVFFCQNSSCTPTGHLPHPLTQRSTSRWEPRSFRHTHGTYLRVDLHELDFATKYGHRCGALASITATCIPRQTLSFTYVWNSSNSTFRTFGHTLLQSPVCDDPYVGTHRQCGEKTFVLTWWYFAV